MSRADDINRAILTLYEGDLLRDRSLLDRLADLIAEIRSETFEKAIGICVSVSLEAVGPLGLSHTAGLRDGARCCLNGIRALKESA